MRLTGLALLLAITGCDALVASRDRDVRKECAALYARARTSTDSLIVDVFRPHDNPYTPACGSTRR